MKCPVLSLKVAVQTAEFKKSPSPMLHREYHTGLPTLHDFFYRQDMDNLLMEHIIY